MGEEGGGRPRRVLGDEREVQALIDVLEALQVFVLADGVGQRPQLGEGGLLLPLEGADALGKQSMDTAALPIRVRRRQAAVENGVSGSQGCEGQGA